MAVTGTVIFCVFSYTFVTDYFEGKLTTFYHQIPRAEAEKLKIWPKFAVCVPYNGTYFSMMELSDLRFKEVQYLKTTKEVKNETQTNFDNIHFKSNLVFVESASDVVDFILWRNNNKKTSETLWKREDSLDHGQCFTTNIRPQTNNVEIRIKVPQAFRDRKSNNIAW